MMDTLLALGITGFFVAIALLACSAAYDNGVNDGYGYSREPENPGYAKAGRYLRKYCGQRWSELRVIGGRWGPRGKEGIEQCK